MVLRELGLSGARLNEKRHWKGQREKPGLVTHSLNPVLCWSSEADVTRWEKGDCVKVPV